MNILFLPKAAKKLSKINEKQRFFPRKRSIYLPLIIAVGLNVFQQFSGINAIMFNAETIFANGGFTDSALAMIILGGVNVASTVLSVAVMDR